MIKAQRFFSVFILFCMLLWGLGLLQFSGFLMKPFFWVSCVLSLYWIWQWCFPKQKTIRLVSCLLLFGVGVFVLLPTFILGTWNGFLRSPESKGIVRCELQHSATLGSSNGLFRYTEYIPVFWNTELVLNTHDMNYAWVDNSAMADLSNAKWIFPKIREIKANANNGNREPFNEVQLARLVYKLTGYSYTVKVDCL